MITYKLNRPIQDGEDVITELKVKESHEVNACDFYGLTAGAEGALTIKSFIEPIASVSGLTTAQVGVLSPKDFGKLSEIVGKYMDV